MKFSAFGRFHGTGSILRSVLQHTCQMESCEPIPSLSPVASFSFPWPTGAEPERVKREIEEVIGLDCSNAIMVSAKQVCYRHLPLYFLASRSAVKAAMPRQFKSVQPWPSIFQQNHCGI